MKLSVENNDSQEQLLFGVSTVQIRSNATNKDSLESLFS
jgi:hypothetical protein